MLRPPRVAAIGSALAPAVVGVAAAAPATAADLTGGQTITANSELTHDLVCPAGTDGLVIGADDIILDLKGFTISGPGARPRLCGGASSAEVRAQKSGITITNGTITGFQSAVVLDQTTGGTVSKLIATDNDRGINLANAHGAPVLKNTVTGNGRDGIRWGA